jgi:pSer/pThr/pTyr-binding forkhead associated (FHA) protein
MKKKPIIFVKLYHIEDPLKGKMQEFAESEICIGRHPDCQVQFPKDLTIVSRCHARILREGNRFKVVNKSPNLTYLNGKEITEEAFLSSGDVLIFARGGPKVSFVTEVRDRKQHPDPQDSSKPTQPIDHDQLGPSNNIDTPPKPHPTGQKDARNNNDNEEAELSLVIQYDVTIKNFQKLPITIGNNPECDFPLDHPEILDQHAKILLRKNQYWVRDLTGKNQVLIDGLLIQYEAPIPPESIVSLSPIGPKFQFFDNGRLIEYVESLPEPPQNNHPKNGSKAHKEPSLESRLKQPVDMLKKLFKR